MLKKLIVIVSISLSLFACSTYNERVTPVLLPSLQNDAIDVEGVLLVAQSFVDEDKAETAFGFDIRGAGLLPIKVVIDNQSNHVVSLVGQQTFLLDQKGQAWPLLSARQANERASDEVQITETALGAGVPSILMGTAGAIAGLAIGVLTGDNLGTAAMKGAVLGGAVGAIYGGAAKHDEIEGDIAYNLADKSLHNQQITPGSLAHGYLFFPGLDEAESAQTLRLSLIINGHTRIVNIGLDGYY
ncbi:MAG: hypothetical protein Q9M50_04470 [Methylococcales bacterium]|nr:hypothetical protein [Methylococcales bacterium]